MVTQPRASGSGETVAPFLRWAGSKRAAISVLSQFAPKSFNKYIEPFAGSACLFFYLRPQTAVLADLNCSLIETYKSVQSSPSWVGRALAALPFGREAYYEVRQNQLKDFSHIQKAARFIYLNRFCFNGLYRTNSSGLFNVPFGSPRNATVPTIDHLKQCSAALKRATLLSGDFEATISDRVEAGDFVYLDPPFFQTEGRVFRQYNSKPFMKNDLERLKRLLEHIDSVGATFILSYANNSDAEQFLHGWHYTTINLQRNIAGFSGARGKASEIVASNRPLVFS